VPIRIDPGRGGEGVVLVGRGWGGHRSWGGEREQNDFVDASLGRPYTPSLPDESSDADTDADTDSLRKDSTDSDPNSLSLKDTGGDGNSAGIHQLETPESSVHRALRIGTDALGRRARASWRRGSIFVSLHFWGTCYTRF